MTVGAQNIPKVAAACTLTIFAVLLTTRCIMDSTASPASSTLKTSSGPNTAGSATPFDPTLHYARLEVSEGKEYEGTGRNIFSAIADRPVVRLQRRPQGQTPTAKAQPSKPGTRLTFFGFAITRSAPKKIFFSEDGDVFVGREGEIINSRYKIVRIGQQSVDLEDLLDNTVQTLALREG